MSSESCQFEKQILLYGILVCPPWLDLLHLISVSNKDMPTSFAWPQDVKNKIILMILEGNQMKW